MGYEALTTAETGQGKFVTAELMAKVKGNFDYFYGLAGGSQGPQVLNGSFEIDSDSDGNPDSWTITDYAGGSHALYTTSPAHGAQALSFVHPGGASNGGGHAESDYIECSQLTTLAIAFILWATAAGMKIQVNALFYTAAKIYVSTTSIYSSTSNPTSATAYIYSFTPPSTARYMKIQLIGGYTDTDVAGTCYFDDVRLNGNPVADLSVSEAKLAASAVSQAKLKTSSGEVSTSVTANLTLPGGKYGFYPQTGVSAWTAGVVSIYLGLYSGTAVYSTNIGFLIEDTATAKAQQTYVTSSGEVFWLYLLRARATGKTISRFASPDHPCMGNGGKPLLKPHPFPDYDGTKHEIIVINPTAEQVKEIEAAMIRGEEEPDVDFLAALDKLFDVDEGAKVSWPEKAATVGVLRYQDSDGNWQKASPDALRRQPDGTPIEVLKKAIPRPEGVKLAGLVAKAVAKG